MTTRKLIKKVFIEAEMELVSGLKIADNKEHVDIGGVDSYVVRRKDNNQPYIPGSSIKGKIRCLLELVAGENATSDAKQTGSDICKLFGAADKSESEPGNPSRIIVRDAYLTQESAEQLKESEFVDMPYTEIKAENTINRVNCVATPRFIERIPAGSVFDVRFVINIYEGDNENALLKLFKDGLKLLENDYLGGSGSRGYGQVKFNELNFTPKTIEEIIK